MKCRYCNNEAELVTGDILYPKYWKDLSGLHFWRCVPCEASVGCKKSKPKVPKGSIAKAELKDKRSKLQALINKVMAFDFIDTKTFYNWMEDQARIINAKVVDLTENNIDDITTKANSIYFLSKKLDKDFEVVFNEVKELRQQIKNEFNNLSEEDAISRLEFYRMNDLNIIKDNRRLLKKHITPVTKRLTSDAKYDLKIYFSKNKSLAEAEENLKALVKQIKKQIMKKLQ